MKLRDYQKDCFDSIYKDLKTRDRVLVQSATGSGKTVIFCHLINHVLKTGNRSFLILVPKIALVEQTLDKLKSFSELKDKKIGVFSASHKRKEIEGVTVASLMSFIRMNEPIDFDCVIVDEAHNGDIEKYLEKINYKKVIGFTATPFFPNGKPIYGKGEFFEKLTYEMDIKSLTKKGYLAPIVFKDSNEDCKLDLSEVVERGGEYVQSSLSKVILKNLDKVKAQIKDAVEKSKNRNKICFMCVSIEHAQFVYMALSNISEDTASIYHSKLPEATAKRNKKEFETLDHVRFMVSVVALGTGYDFPALDCLVLMRPTKSYVLYVQAVGRILRLSEGKKDALFLDYGRVIENLGDPYALKMNNAKSDYKLCRKCFSYVDKNLKVCSECGEEFKVVIREEPKTRDMFKNTTERSYSGSSGLEGLNSFISLKEGVWYSVFDVRMSKYTAKSGKECVKVTYSFKECSTPFNEYRFPYSVDRYLEEKHEHPKRVQLKKQDNGYFKIDRVSYNRISLDRAIYNVESRTSN